MTLPLIRLLQQGPAGLAERVRQLLPGAGQPQARAAAAVPGGERRPGLRPAQAEDFAAQARKELACLPPSPCRAILEAVTDRVVHRSH